MIVAGAAATAIAVPKAVKTLARALMIATPLTLFAEMGFVATNHLRNFLMERT